ncbi:hypothetical protein GJAV_G00039190 [Gymnothorax javanicus]|nr:hypothetical protein GJAV_G00039190 [Gymnothorax javanicus]
MGNHSPPYLELVWSVTWGSPRPAPPPCNVLFGRGLREQWQVRINLQLDDLKEVLSLLCVARVTVASASRLPMVSHDVSSGQDKSSAG